MRDNIKGGALTETTLLVLLSLYTPRHGYEVNKHIQKVTQGRVSLGAGTLYKVIDTLLKKGWINSIGDKKDRKNTCVISEEGKQVVYAEKMRLSSLIALIKEREG